MNSPEPVKQAAAPPPPSDAVRAALESLIRNDALTVVFQPIVDLATGEVTGHEALTRPDHSTVFGAGP